MVHAGSASEDDGWASVSDLGEYAYCPRAFWYRHHRPSVALDPAATRSQRAGRRYHQRQLVVEVSAERHRDWWVILALVATTVLAAATLAWLWT